jgi:sulfite reductase (NADPH) flavoprotein alpha-component
MNTIPLVSIYTRQNPFLAKITQNYPLTKEGSDKETRHIVVNTAGSGLKYVPGASLGVLAQNPPEQVDELLKLLKIDPQSQVGDAASGIMPVRVALLKVYTINRVSKKFVKGVAEKLPIGPEKEKLTGFVANDELLTNYIDTRDCIDVILEYPQASITAPELISLLTKSMPRLYSIASSPDAHPNEVHMTVAVVSYVTHGRQKLGLASGWLGHYALPGTLAPVYIQPSKHFHLPPTGDVPMIMVGPGTGIAPFRAFIEQRAFDKAKGKNWLFFGDQHHATDFLYEEEFNEFKKQGVLTRIDTAFSRDQANKIYVQDRMRENAAELWKWIKNGAYFYVCGDAKRMAKDVHQALIDIVQNEGGMKVEAATEYVEVNLMKTEKRYLRDVY